MINYKTQRKNNQTRNPPKNEMDYPGWPISKGRGGWWSWSCFVRKQIHEFAKKPRCVSSQHQSATCGSLPSHAFNELCKCLNCFCWQGISCTLTCNVWIMSMFLDLSRHTNPNCHGAGYADTWYDHANEYLILCSQFGHISPVLVTNPM